MFKLATTYTITLLFLFLTTNSIFGQSNMVDREDELKAVYVYQFAKYVEWNDKGSDLADKLIVVVLGETPVQKYLKQLSKDAKTSTIRERRMVIQSCNNVNDLINDHLRCHILFVPQHQKVSKDQLRVLATKNILLLGEANNFLKDGGMINFSLQRNTLQFEINQSEIAHYDFIVNPKLLKLAKFASRSPSSDNDIPTRLVNHLSNPAMIP